MRPNALWILLLLPLILLFAACGDDDDGGIRLPGNDDRDNATATRSSGDDGDNATATTSGGDADETQPASSGDNNGDVKASFPTVADGAYSKGRVRVEISGDEDLVVEADGSAFAADGYVLFTYASPDAAVLMGFSKKAEDEPGAVSITTADLATGGSWGEDCTIKVSQSGNKLSGEFSCNDAAALDPGSLDDKKVDIKGTFSVEK